MSILVDINPNILKQVIEREPLIKANENVEKWIRGEKKPTLKQLEKFSKTYHVPFGFLFLNNLPDYDIKIPFFRQQEDTPISTNTIAIIQTLERNQEWLKEYLIHEEYEPLEFVGKYKEDTPAKDIVNDIRNVLDLETGWTNKEESKEACFNSLVEKLQKFRINVVSSSVVGNNTRRKIPLSECRGFVLVDEYSPFVFVHRDDYDNARIFTLLHEIAHIWLGESACFQNEDLLPYDDKIEKKCNEIAGELLLTEEDFNTIWRTDKSIGENIKNIADEYNLSKFVCLIKAYKLEKINLPEYKQNFHTLAKKVKKGKSQGGGNYYRNVPNRVGKVFLEYIQTALTNRSITFKSACNLTGLNLKTFDTYMDEYGDR